MHQLPQVRQHQLGEGCCLFDVRIHTRIHLFIRHHNLFRLSTQQYTQLSSWWKNRMSRSTPGSLRREKTQASTLRSAGAVATTGKLKANDSV
jgi:hypothetical protein